MLWHPIKRIQCLEPATALKLISIWGHKRINPERCARLAKELSCEINGGFENKKVHQKATLVRGDLTMLKFRIQWYDCSLRERDVFDWANNPEIGPIRLVQNSNKKRSLCAYLIWLKCSKSKYWNKKLLPCGHLREIEVPMTQTKVTGIGYNKL